MPVSFDTLIRLAAKGDSVAMSRLLALYDARLRARVARRITPDLQALLSPEDVLQEAYVEVFRHLGKFEPRGADAFYHWLATIAEHKLIDAVKALRAAKRPPPHQAATPPGDRSTSLLALAEMVQAGGDSPSGAVAKQEAAQAVQVALAALPEPERRALWMRHVEGRSVREVAEALGRTEHAVHQLCQRGLAHLRERLGSRSRYLSR